MLSLIVLCVLLLAVVVFALQNAQAVTVRFLFWQLESSVAVVALGATAAGVLIAELFHAGEPPAALETRPAREGSGGPAGLSPSSLDSIRQAVRAEPGLTCTIQRLGIRAR